MQRRTSSPRWIAGMLATVLATPGMSHIGRAEVMNSGTGASAYVSALGQSDSQVGSAPASATGTKNVNYTLLSGSTGTTNANAAAAASATPGGTYLLQVQNYRSSFGSQGPFV